MRFELNAEEKSRYEQWNEKHLKLAHGGVEPYTGAIGGRVSFRIVGTSIGEIVSAECGFCMAVDGLNRRELLEAGAAIVLTDFSDW